MRAPVARGGMGTVYSALQQSTGDVCAVKVMHPELLHDERSRERFTREAELCAMIRNEHVVRVIASGIDASTETPWIAMELVTGEDLERFFRRRGALPVDEARALLAQLFDAVGAAHHHGVVHRDLKPANVLLASTGDEAAPPCVKVLDFGISKQLFEQGTETTAAVGSPLWMAPEQAQRGRLTPATDVFALALITFRMLTGKIYWVSGGQARPAIKDMLVELLVKPFLPASARAKELQGTSVPAGFDAWFDRATARDPVRRYVDAATAWQALAPVLDGAEPAATSTAPDNGPGGSHETPDDDAVATIALVTRRGRDATGALVTPAPSETPSVSLPDIPRQSLSRSPLRSPTATPLPDLLRAAKVERESRKSPTSSHAFVITAVTVLLLLVAAVVVAVNRGAR